MGGGVSKRAVFRTGGAQRAQLLVLRIPQRIFYRGPIIDARRRIVRLRATRKTQRIGRAWEKTRSQKFVENISSRAKRRKGYSEVPPRRKVDSPESASFPLRTY